MFKDRERPVDNPEKHQGRIRSRPHIDGSWPVHVYLDVKLSEEMFDIVSSFTESARKLVPKTISMLQSIQAMRADPKATPIEAKSAEDATELHISLTRPIYLQALHIGRFVSDVREAFKGKKRFNVSFSGLQAFSNDDKTRSFLSLRIGSGHSELERLLVEMDEIVERYAQPKFYEEPEFHASFAWAVGGDSLTKEVVDSVEETEEELGNDLRQCSVLVRRVAWKTEVNPTDDIIVLRNKIAAELKITDPSTITVSDQPSAGATPMDSLSGKSLAELGVKHGDLLYIGFAAAAVEQPAKPSSTVIQDAVDDYLDTQNGLIKRDKDAKLYAFRLVDHVEFSTASIIDNFIGYWRSTGLQRFGYMYGRYEPYPEVPLGIKAVVEAIYEPPQEGDSEGLRLDSPIEGEKRADEMAAACGLQRVGMIYTDLTDDGSGKGTVLCKRHIDSYFFSSQECHFAAVMQQKYPNATKYSSTGTFGSKFVTCVIGGNEEGNIDVSSYQVSNTCVGMVDADIVEPSVEPGIMRVKEPSAERYIPDVFFKYKNEYNVTVQKSAKPSFPVEYLLVNVTHGFPLKSSPLFTSSKEFLIENRVGGGFTQDAGALYRYLQSGKIVDLASDFHFLLFTRSMSILNDNEEMTLLVRLALLHKEEDAVALEQSPGWQTLLTVLKESAGSSSSGGQGSSSGGAGGSRSASAAAAPWTCRHCTFLNTHGDENCEMCGLPMG
ncbi:nuclear protein localization protein 4 [Podila epicladia]|nr:nuclear protein localization protein 4 [Podila epicladia]